MTGDGSDALPSLSGGGPSEAGQNGPAGIAIAGQASDASQYEPGMPTSPGGENTHAGAGESQTASNQANPGGLTFNDLLRESGALDDGQQQGVAGGANAQSSGGAAGSGTSTSAGSGSGQSSESGSVASLNEKNTPDDVAIRRGVGVAVYADRLLVGKQAEGVAMPGPTAEYAPQFVAAVRRQIDAWGLAGQGLYWRPVIKLDIRQGGSQRAREIETILRRSGVDVETARTAAWPGLEGDHATR